VSADVKPNLLKPRWSKVFSDLWDDKTRTVLVVASIAVGVFALGMIITAYVILAQDINSSYAAINPPNIEIWTDPFGTDLEHAVEKIPGIQAVQGRRTLTVRGRQADADWRNLKLIAPSDFSGNVNRLVAVEGASVPAEGEVVVSESMMFSTGFHAGDRIEIELPDGSIRSLTVAGMVTDQTASEPDGNSDNNAYVSLDTLRSFGLPDYFNQIFATVAGDGSDPEHIATVASRVEDQVKRSQRQVYRTEEKLSNEHPMIDTVLAVIGVLGALGALITILSSSLIINTLNALLTQQRRQIGVMKLIGGRSFQILGMYLTLIIIYGLIALAIAVPLGAAAGYALALFIANMMGAVLQGFRFIPAAIITQALLAVLIPLAAGFFPVNSGARTSVQRAISNYRPPARTQRSRFPTLNLNRIRWIPRPILLSFRNTFRKRGRLVLTIFTLSVAGAVFIAVFNVRDSMNTVMDQLMQHFLGDVTVSFSQPYRVSKIDETLMGVPGVEGVEGWGGASGEIHDAQDELVTPLAIVAPPSGTQLIRPDMLAGRWLLPGDTNALVVSDAIYQFYPDLVPGDTLSIELTGQRTEPWVVVGVFRFMNMLGDPLAYANFDYVAGKMHTLNRAASFRIITGLHDADTQLSLARRIDTYLSDENFLVQSVESGLARRESATQAVNILIIFLLIMAILTAVVGSIGLTGTMSINVLERTREIGVMRTIGAVDLRIMQSVMIEGLVIGLITWLIAIGLSFPISSLLLTIIGESMMGSSLALSYTPLGILLWLAVVIFLSAFASLMPARNAARLTINEVLAYE